MTITCLCCRHAFERDIAPHSEYVTCPACRLRVPVPRPVFAHREPPEERLAVVERADDLPLALPADPPAGLGSVSVPQVDLLRPWDFAVVSRSRSGRTLSYELLDAGSGQPVGDLIESVSASDRLLRAFVKHRSQMKAELVLTDRRSDEAVLLIERGQFKGVVKSRPCLVKLWGPGDRLLAWFEAGRPALKGWMVDWNADCDLHDAGDRRWASAEGPKYPQPDYELLRREGRWLAQVRGEGHTSGLFAPGISWTAQGGELRVRLNDRAVEGPAEKLALLGTALAYESIISSLYLARPR